MPEDVARYRGRFQDGWDVLRRRRLERMRQLGIVDCELSARTPGVPAWESLSAEQKDRLFSGCYEFERSYFDKLEKKPRELTAQDRAFYSLCRPEPTAFT